MPVPSPGTGQILEMSCSPLAGWLAGAGPEVNPQQPRRHVVSLDRLRTEKGSFLEEDTELLLSGSPPPSQFQI